MPVGGDDAEKGADDNSIGMKVCKHLLLYCSHDMDTVTGKYR